MRNSLATVWTVRSPLWMTFDFLRSRLSQNFARVAHRVFAHIQ
jgi:hypothetical protein